MSKRIAWSLLKIPKPDGSRTLQQYLKQGLNYFDFFHPVQGKYVLEIGSEEIKNLDRRPTTSELQQAWRIAAADLAAEQEMEHVAKKITDFQEGAAAPKNTQFPRETIALQLQKKEAPVNPDMKAAEMKEAETLEARMQKLLNEVQMEVQAARKEAANTERCSRLMALGLSGRYFPSLKMSRETASEKEKVDAPDVFTKCEVSQVMRPIPPLPNEEAFMAEVGQVMDKHGEAELEESQATAAVTPHPLLQQQLRAIERVARSRGWRMNKLFYKEEGDNSDYVCTSPDESLSCSANTLFYLQAKKLEEPSGMSGAMMMDGTMVWEQPNTSADFLLKASTARVVARIAGRKFAMPTLARIGLGVACDDKHIVFVRVDLEDEPKIPVYVSEVLPIAEGLRYLARLMCCPSAEQFGLVVGKLLELLPSSYKYVRALGSGSDTEVVAVRDEARAEQSELACKYATMHDVEPAMAHEARILGRLQTIATGGVPKLVHFYGGERKAPDEFGQPPRLLVTSPVGTPLLEHVKSLRGEGERHSFAQKVFEELKAALSAVHAKGIVHANIAPENIVVVPCENGDDVTVCLIHWSRAADLQEEKPWAGTGLFMSDELLRTQKPAPQDDEQALLLTFVAIRESPTAEPPWPCECGMFSFDHEALIGARSPWLKEYATKHPELDLTSLLK